MHTEARSPEPADQLIDKENPWPGLSAFTEENALFFHGRDKEALELFRLIKRETLTVLFGLSGLGKTSLLQAGVFPLLRRDNFLPVYVRLNYADGAPDLMTQAKECLREGSAKAEISSPPILPGESLWAYFHRTTNEFKADDGTIITPVLIFDQFEEMFTLGSNSDECQQRITLFLSELGDLIENRPPETVEKELESEAEEAFSFYKNEYKVVFTLREDFLANLESLANQLPSITHNRLRLQKMNGAQALEVVLKAGDKLVDADVAEKIVKMVAGRGAYDTVALGTLEIEPTLLSVFCRELNNNRVTRGDSRITPQLLSGSKDAILVGFYDRALQGFDERIRYFIEDKLLTGSGYRNSVDLQDALTVPGISRDAIFALIDRRLLRIEDSARMPRVELTHDVLTEVIKKSRDERQAREAAAKAEEQRRRSVEEMRAKDEELRKTKKHNRGMQFLCFLAFIAICVSIWYWTKAVRAEKRAELAVSQIQASNDRADVFIENTLKDLHRKLSGLGRVAVLDQTAKDALPLLEQQEVDEGGSMSDTQLRFQGSAYSTLGDVLRANSDIKGALDCYDKSLKSAQRIVDSHRNDADPTANIANLRDLAEKLSGLSNTLDGGSKADALVFEAKYPEASELYDQSTKVTQQVAAIATKAQDKIWVDRQTANIWVRQGDLLRQTSKFNEAQALYQKSFDLRKRIAGDDPANEACQIDLANAYSRLGTLNTSLGHFDLALHWGLPALDIRKKYAQLHEDDVNWQRSLFYSYLTLGRLLLLEGKLAGDDGAYVYLTTGLNKESDLAAQNPVNVDLQRESAIGRIFLGNYYRAVGDWKNAQDSFTKARDQILSHQDSNNLMWNNFVGVAYLDVGDALAQQSNWVETAKNYQAALDIFQILVKKNPKNSDWQHNLALTYSRIGYIDAQQKNQGGARDNYVNSIKTYQATLQINPNDPINNNGLAWLLATCPIADLRDGADAVQAAQKGRDLTDGKAWEEIDTLAAADAESKNFPQAEADEKTALSVVDPSDKNEISGMQSRLDLYQKKAAIHPSPLANSDR